MAKSTHIHQYERRDIGAKKTNSKGQDVSNTYIVFHCRLPNCFHYLAPDLALGKLSICPYCEEAYQLQRKHLALALPHCDNCKDENHPKVREAQGKVPKEAKKKVSSGLGETLAKLRKD